MTKDLKKIIRRILNGKRGKAILGYNSRHKINIHQSRLIQNKNVKGRHVSHEEDFQLIPLYARVEFGPYSLRAGCPAVQPIKGAKELLLRLCLLGGQNQYQQR